MAVEPINRVFVGGDGKGASYANRLFEALKTSGYDATFVPYRRDDRPAHVAERLALLVLKDPLSRGILVCGTGLGIAANANKVTEVTAVGPITTDHAAKRAALSNNANIISFAAFGEGKTTPPILTTLSGALVATSKTPISGTPRATRRKTCRPISTLMPSTASRSRDGKICLAWRWCEWRCLRDFPLDRK